MQTIVVFILLFFSISASSQTTVDSVHWISIEEAGEQFREQQKPVLFYFYKNNCDSCEFIEQTTFSNPEVANYINILFYPVKIDIETNDSLTFFDGVTYTNSGKHGSIHDLAYKLTGGYDSLPSLVLFSRRAAGRNFTGYKNRDEIFRILIYYAEDIDIHTEFEDWYKYHKKGYPPGQSQIVTRLNVKWKPIDEAQELMKDKPKKMLLNFYNYNRISCTLMRTQTYNQKNIADYLNENFYPVNIDVYTSDTIKIKGITYINENKPYKYHQLPIAALEGKMTFPAFIILDEEGNVLQKHQQYMIPERFEEVIRYYGDDAYKTQKFKEFVKTFESKLEK